MDSNRSPLMGIRPEPSKGKAVSVADLTHMCNDAASKMSDDNPHKILLLNCGYAMQQLVDRIEELELQTNPQKVM